MRVFAALALFVFTFAAASARALAQDGATATPAVPLCTSPDQPGRTLLAIPAHSPAQARGVSGMVVVVVTLDAKSNLTNATISRSPSALLNAAAQDSARASTFQTAIRDCHPVPMSFRFLVYFKGSAAARAAATPSISDYFVGTWSCTSELRGAVVLAFGLSNAAAFVLAEAYVTPARTWGASVQTYVESGAVITVTERHGSRTFTGTSDGWNGDRLRFNGLASIAAVPAAPALVPGATSERMTYTRVDRDHFERALEGAPVDTGPWTTMFHESCARIAPP